MIGLRPEYDLNDLQDQLDWAKGKTEREFMTENGPEMMTYQEHQDWLESSEEPVFSGSTANEAIAHLQARFGPLYHSKDTYHCPAFSDKELAVDTVAAILIYLKSAEGERNENDFKRKYEGKIKHVLCQHKRSDLVVKIWTILDEMHDNTGNWLDRVVSGYHAIFQNVPYLSGFAGLAEATHKALGINDQLDVIDSDLAATIGSAIGTVVNDDGSISIAGEDMNFNDIDWLAFSDLNLSNVDLSNVRLPEWRDIDLSGFYIDLSGVELPELSWSNMDLSSIDFTVPNPLLTWENIKWDTIDLSGLVNQSDENSPGGNGGYVVPQKPTANMPWYLILVIALVGAKFIFK